MAKATKQKATGKVSPYNLRSLKTPEPSSPISKNSTISYDPYAPDDYESDNLHLKLYPGGLEHIEDYNAGGHHPVHLGDYIQDGRYRVIHKLGNGGFANVWLCRDMHIRHTTKYVALKILRADVSTDDCPELFIAKKLERLLSESDQDKGAKYICRTLDQFEIQGPNGRHFCFVTPVLGPRVSSCICANFEDPDKFLRTVCFKVTQTMSYLHSKGICHGGELICLLSTSESFANQPPDFTPYNILFRTSGLDGLSEVQILEVFGTPQKNPVLNQFGKIHTEATAPKYLVFPADTDMNPKYLSEEPCIIDFGESFEISKPPKDLGIPRPYNSPELILEKAAGFNTDVWALGCTIFEIRTGRKIFAPSTMGDEPDEYIVDMVDVLGPLPEPWWSTTWKGRREMFKDEADKEGRAVYAKPPPPEHSEEEKRTSHGHPVFPENPRSLREKLASGVYYMGEDSDVHREISEEEIEVFGDLLGRILKLDSKQRLEAKAVLEHEWFKM